MSNIRVKKVTKPPSFSTPFTSSLSSQATGSSLLKNNDASVTTVFNQRQIIGQGSASVFPNLVFSSIFQGSSQPEFQEDITISQVTPPYTFDLHDYTMHEFLELDYLINTSSQLWSVHDVQNKTNGFQSFSDGVNLNCKTKSFIENSSVKNLSSVESSFNLDTVGAVYSITHDLWLQPSVYTHTHHFYSNVQFFTVERNFDLMITSNSSRYQNVFDNFVGALFSHDELRVEVQTALADSTQNTLSGVINAVIGKLTVENPQVLNTLLWDESNGNTVPVWVRNTYRTKLDNGSYVDDVVTRYRSPTQNGANTNPTLQVVLTDTINAYERMVRTEGRKASFRIVQGTPSWYLLSGGDNGGQLVEELGKWSLRNGARFFNERFVLDTLSSILSSPPQTILSRVDETSIIAKIDLPTITLSADTTDNLEQIFNLSAGSVKSSNVAINGAIFVWSVGASEDGLFVILHRCDNDITDLRLTLARKNGDVYTTLSYLPVIYYSHNNKQCSERSKEEKEEISFLNKLFRMHNFFHNISRNTLWNYKTGTSSSTFYNTHSEYDNAWEGGLYTFLNSIKSEDERDGTFNAYVNGNPQFSLAGAVYQRNEYQNIYNAWQNVTTLDWYDFNATPLEGSNTDTNFLYSLQRYMLTHFMFLYSKTTFYKRMQELNSELQKTKLTPYNLYNSFITKELLLLKSNIDVNNLLDLLDDFFEQHFNNNNVLPMPVWHSLEQSSPNLQREYLTNLQNVFSRLGNLASDIPLFRASNYFYLPTTNGGFEYLVSQDQQEAVTSLATVKDALIVGTNKALYSIRGNTLLTLQQTKLSDEGVAPAGVGVLSTNLLFVARNRKHLKVYRQLLRTDYGTTESIDEACPFFLFDFDVGIHKLAIVGDYGFIILDNGRLLQITFNNNQFGLVEFIFDDGDSDNAIYVEDVLPVGSGILKDVGAIITVRYDVLENGDVKDSYLTFGYYTRDSGVYFDKKMIKHIEGDTFESIDKDFEARLSIIDIDKSTSETGFSIPSIFVAGHNIKNCFVDDRHEASGKIYPHYTKSNVPTLSDGNEFSNANIDISVGSGVSHKRINIYNKDKHPLEISNIKLELKKGI